jgi:hypothetical protein
LQLPENIHSKNGKNSGRKKMKKERKKKRKKRKEKGALNHTRNIASRFRHF